MCRYNFRYTSCLHTVEGPLECLTPCTIARTWRMLVFYHCPQCIEACFVAARNKCIEEMTTSVEVSA